MDTGDYSETRITMREAVTAAVKTALVIMLAFLALYALNSALADLVDREQAEKRIAFEQRQAEAKERREQMLQEQNDRLAADEEYYLSAFFDAEIINHYDGQFLELGEKIVNAEYIFIGTSHVAHGITPQVFYRQSGGTRFFNFALNGSNPSYYLWWYNDVFKGSGYNKPKAVIVGVDWFMFDSNWLWRRPDYDFRYLRTPRPPPDIEQEGTAEDELRTESDAMRFTGAWYNIDDVVTYVMNRLPIFFARERFIDLILPERGENPEEIINEVETDEKPAIVPALRPQMPPGGWSDGWEMDKFYQGYVPWQASFDGFNGQRRSDFFNDEQYADFRTLISQFKADGIEVVFVMAPEFMPDTTIPQLEEMVGIINRIAEEENIPFLNYNTEFISEINRGVRYYSDPGHMNDSGAQAFSRILYDDLNAILKFEISQPMN